MMKKINTNSPKTISLIGLGLLLVAIIFFSNSLISTFCVLSGFLFLIISLVKIIISRFSKSKKTRKPFRFWIIMAIFLPLLFLVLYFGSKNPSPKKEKVAQNNPTEIITPTVAIKENKQTETTPTVTTTPQPTSKPTQPITTLENGKLVFNDLGWEIYTSQFIKSNSSLNNDCDKDMETCPYWEKLATQNSVRVSDVKFIFYEASSVALNDKYQKIYDNYNTGLSSLSEQTDEAGEAFEKSFVLKNGLKDYELKAIIAKGLFYKPDTSSLETFVRETLIKTNKIINERNIVIIVVFNNEETKDTSLDKIVHIYYKPDSAWDEKSIVSDTANKAVNSMKLLFSKSEITHIVFWTLGDFTDSYGKKYEQTALRVGLNSTTASKIQWDNFIPMVGLDYKKLFDIADDKYVHNSIADKLNWNWR